MHAHQTAGSRGASECLYKTPSAACVFFGSSLGLQNDPNWHWFVVWTWSSDSQGLQTPPPSREALLLLPVAGLWRLPFARDLPGKQRGSSRKRHSGTAARQGWQHAGHLGCWEVSACRQQGLLCRWHRRHLWGPLAQGQVLLWKELAPKVPGKVPSSRAWLWPGAAAEAAAGAAREHLRRRPLGRSGAHWSSTELTFRARRWPQASGTAASRQWADRQVPLSSLGVPLSPRPCMEHSSLGDGGQCVVTPSGVSHLVSGRLIVCTSPHVPVPSFIQYIRLDQGRAVCVSAFGQEP